MRMSPGTAFVLLLLLSASACHQEPKPPDSHMTASLFDKIHKGMTTTEVERLAGPPTFELSGGRLSSVRIPAECSGRATLVYLYARPAPQDSYYVFFEEKHTVCGTNTAAFFIAY
jgi:hypothetical protein